MLFIGSPGILPHFVCCMVSKHVSHRLGVRESSKDYQACQIVHHLIDGMRGTLFIKQIYRVLNFHTWSRKQPLTWDRCHFVDYMVTFGY